MTQKWAGNGWFNKNITTLIQYGIDSVYFVDIFLIVCRIRHNERLEFLGDAVLELISRWNTLDNYYHWFILLTNIPQFTILPHHLYLFPSFCSFVVVVVFSVFLSYSSVHLYFMLPSKTEGGLAMYRTALVQNRHLAQLGKVNHRHVWRAEIW